jgi:hypothetical protein
MRDDELVQLYLRDKYADRLLSRIMFACALILMLGFAVSMIAGCDEQRGAQGTVTIYDTVNQMEDVTDKFDATREDDFESQFCMPCVGPHINLSTGELDNLSMGPGLDLF